VSGNSFDTMRRLYKSLRSYRVADDGSCCLNMLMREAKPSREADISNDSSRTRVRGMSSYGLTMKPFEIRLLA